MSLKSEDHEEAVRRFGIDETVDFICSMAQIKSRRDEEGI